jgi:hypothetical protein
MPWSRLRQPGAYPGDRATDEIQIHVPGRPNKPPAVTGRRKGFVENYEPSERLKAALSVGSAEALFPVLNHWSTEELRALLVDVSTYYDFIHTATESAWKDTAMQVDYFFNREKSIDLDKQFHKMRIEILETCSEICSVVYYYLDERGEDYEGKNDES